MSAPDEITIQRNGPAFSACCSAAARFGSALASWTSPAFAVLLLAAAGLKAEAILAQNTAEPLVFGRQAWEWAVVGTEWSVGAWILASGCGVWARRVAMGMLAAFLAVAGARAIRGDADCGCFGRLHSSPLWTLCIDAIALVGIWYSIREARRREGTVSAIAVGGALRPYGAGLLSLLVICVPTGAILGTSYIHPAVRSAEPLVVLDPPSWKARRFPLLDHLQHAQQDLSRGRWAVVLVNRNCQTCMDFLSHVDFRAIARAGGTDDPPRAIAAIDLSQNARPRATALELPVPVISMRPGALYLADGPFEVFLNDGIVEAAFRPAIP